MIFKFGGYLWQTSRLCHTCSSCREFVCLTAEPFERLIVVFTAERSAADRRDRGSFLRYRPGLLCGRWKAESLNSATLLSGPAVCHYHGGVLRSIFFENQLQTLFNGRSGLVERCVDGGLLSRLCEAQARVFSAVPALKSAQASSALNAAERSIELGLDYCSRTFLPIYWSVCGLLLVLIIVLGNRSSSIFEDVDFGGNIERGVVNQLVVLLAENIFHFATPSFPAPALKVAFAVFVSSQLARSLSSEAR